MKRSIKALLQPRNPTPRSQTMTLDGVEVEVRWKAVRTLRLTVRGPTGQAWVSAPLHTPEDTVRDFVTGRLDWVRTHQSRLRNHALARAPALVDGATVPWLGQPLVLRVVSVAGRPTVVQDGPGMLRMEVREGSKPEEREAMLYRWYRARLGELVPTLVAKWEPVVGVHALEWRLRRMKTRWGTCNTRDRRIWLNVELARVPLHCVEYVVVHELVHLVERSHNARFWGLVTTFMPDWRRYRAELNNGQARDGDC